MAYNGWTNKETWLVNLWLGDVLVMLQEDGVEITAELIESEVEGQIEAQMADGSSTFTGFLADMLNCALGEIDYDELAAHYPQETVE